MVENSPLPPLDGPAMPIVVIALVAAFFLYILPFLLYPFQLFFTLIHEMAHVFVTRLTGGQMKGFWIFADDSGVSVREGGDSLLVKPAGYLGVALVSAALILLTLWPQYAPYVLATLGGILLLFLFLYGQQSRQRPQATVTVPVALGFGVGLIAVAWLLPPEWSVFLLNLLAVQGAFFSLSQIANLAEGGRAKPGTHDASDMAQLTPCSATFWVWTWYLASLSILAVAIWFAWLRLWLIST
jgi:hypothetical protein